MGAQDHPVYGRPIVRREGTQMDPMRYLVDGPEACREAEAWLAGRLGVAVEDPRLEFHWHAVVTTVGYDDGRGVSMPWTHTGPDGSALALPDDTVRVRCLATHTTPAPVRPAGPAGDHPRP